LREVYLHGWSGLDTAERTRLALEPLVDAYWVRPADSDKEAQGGRPAEAYLINPKLKTVKL